jgi:hypothetical protein
MALPCSSCARSLQSCFMNRTMLIIMRMPTAKPTWNGMYCLNNTYVIIIYDRSLGARKDLGKYSQWNGRMRVSLLIILPLMAVICLMDQGSPLPIQIYICSIMRFVPSYIYLVLIHMLWQYIVYDPSQIRLRYLLMVDMNWQSQKRMRSVVTVLMVLKLLV